MLALFEMQKNQLKHVNKFSLISFVVWLFPAVVRRLAQKGTIRAAQNRGRRILDNIL